MTLIKFPQEEKLEDKIRKCIRTGKGRGFSFSRGKYYCKIIRQFSNKEVDCIYRSDIGKMWSEYHQEECYECHYNNKRNLN